MKLSFQAYWRYFQGYVNHGPWESYFRAHFFLLPKGPKQVKITFLAILLKSFHCLTMKLGLQAYRRYFRVCVNHGLLGPTIARRSQIFRPFFDLEKAKIDKKIQVFPYFLEIFLLCVHEI